MMIISSCYQDSPVVEEPWRLEELEQIMASETTASNGEDPRVVINAGISKNNYLQPVVRLLQNKNEVLERYPPGMYYQSLAVSLSLVGCAGAAHEAWSRQLDSADCYPVLDNSTTWQALQKHNAHTAIMAQAEEHQITLINEAHHVADHRRFTTSLLADLYAAGYRYLAAETVIAGRVGALNDRKYPYQNTGTYTQEPQYSDLLRQALAIGYEIVAYEAGSGYSYSDRDSIQALNILKVLTRDTTGKILVHAGYGHIHESSKNDWTKMGEYLRRLGGIDPLTIDQVGLMNRGGLGESCYYRPLVEQYNIEEPSIFTDVNDHPWWTPELKGFVDLQVIHPLPNVQLGREVTISLDGREVHEVILPDALIDSFLLVQAYNLTEVDREGRVEQLVPVDQFLKRRGQTKVPLLLRDGSYLLRFLSAASGELSTQQKLFIQ